MEAMHEYWITLLLIIGGSFVGGLVTGLEMARREVLRRLERRGRYDCDICGEPMTERLPPGLRGRFVHAACEFESEGYGSLAARIVK